MQKVGIWWLQKVGIGWMHKEGIRLAIGHCLLHETHQDTNLTEADGFVTESSLWATNPSDGVATANVYCSESFRMGLSKQILELLLQAHFGVVTAYIAALSQPGWVFDDKHLPNSHPDGSVTVTPQD